MITLQENEKLRRRKRRHWIVIKLQLAVIVPIILIITGLLIASLFAPVQELPDRLIEVIPGLDTINLQYAFAFLLSIVLLFLWQTIFIILIPFYLDSWIITDQRVVHSEVKGLFNHHIYTIPLYRIQDATVRKEGILASIFSFGDVRVQTAATSNHEFWLSQIPDPYGTKEEILKAKETYRRPPRLQEHNRETEDGSPHAGKSGGNALG